MPEREVIPEKFRAEIEAMEEVAQTAWAFRASSGSPFRQQTELCKRAMFRAVDALEALRRAKKGAADAAS